MANYTDAELRAAWASLQNSRQHWPATFEEAMAHPLYSRLVRIQVFHVLVETVIKHRDIGPAHADVPPVELGERRELARGQSFPLTKRASTGPLPQRRAIDQKSLAAGEKPEDSDF